MKKSFIKNLLIIVFGVALTATSFAQNKKNTKPSSNKKPMTDFRSVMPKPGPAPLIQIPDYTVHELKNGMKVIVVENHKLPRVSFQLFIDNDPILEKESNGFVDLAGNMLGKGTNKRTKADIDEAIDFIGGNFSASISGFYANSLSKHSEKLLEVVSDCVLDPNFPASEFEKLKSQTLSGLQQSKDDPNTIAQNVASVLNFGKDFPYGEITTEKSINNVSLEQCKAYYKEYFKPNNAYFTVVGDIKPQEAVYLAEKYFGSWEKGNVPSNTYKTPQAPAKPEVSFVNKDGAVQSVVLITYPIVLKPGTEDVIKVSVMNNILGGGAFSARLFQNLREKHAFTYGAYSKLGSDKLISKFSASASVRNEVTDSSITQFLYEMNRMRTEKVTEKELVTIKNMLAGDFSRSLESPQTVASFALSTIRYNLPKDYYKNYLTRLEAVNYDDVLNAAQKYIQPDHVNIIVVGNKDQVADKLKGFSADKQVHYYNAFGEKIQENANFDVANIKPEAVIQDYINAIGGAEKLNGIKDVHIETEANFQGMALKADKYQKVPDKFCDQMSMNGMVMQQQIVNGNKGVTGQMGQNQAMDEKELKDASEDMAICVQQKYIADKYALKLAGVENIDGKDAYKILVTTPSGNTKVEYYDVNSKLKLRETTTQTAGEKSISMTTDFEDYKPEQGILFPHKITVSGGMMPAPIVMEVKSISINKGIEDSIFKVD